MTLSHPERLLTPFVAPAEEPVTLAEAKLYLRVDGTQEDTLIAEMIEAARQSIEHYIRRSLVTQQWKLTMNDCIPALTSLPMGPVISIVAVHSISKEATVSVISNDHYRLNASRTLLESISSISGYQVEVIYEAGYGNASEVPASLRQAVLAHVADLYDGRSRSMPLSSAVQSLLMPFREVSL